MNRTVALIGVGEMGGVFARGLLRAGHPVYPVTREMDLSAAALAVPEPAMALVAVAENDLHPVLANLPERWRDRVGLLQNELLPRDWQRHGLEDPTVISVWFEKKKGQEAKVIIPSPVFGPRAELLASALANLEIPTRVLETRAELLEELVIKNLYILTSNIAGLEVGGTVGELLSIHSDLTHAVALEVLELQEWLTDHTFSSERMLTALEAAFTADPDHRCTGRSAPQRLARALALAQEGGLELTRLKRIHEEQR